MEIKQHNLVGTQQQTTPNMGGTITPRFIVMHYTAGWSAEGSISWLTNKKSKVSAHLVIGRDGSITQLVPFNRKAWHAGPSAYEGFRNLNTYSIGIELDNAGWMTEVSQGVYTGSNGHKLSASKMAGVETIKGSHPNVEGGAVKDWMMYTDAQLQALEDVVDALLDKYPTIQYITGHDEIDTRGYKSDPGPAFPRENFAKKMINRNDEKPVQYKVDVDSLNVRGGPGIEYDKLSVGPLSRGTVLTLLERDDSWLFVEFDEINKGYVHGKYITRIGS